MHTVGESEHCLSKVSKVFSYVFQQSFQLLMSNIVEWLKFIPGIWTKVCVVDDKLKNLHSSQLVCYNLSSSDFETLFVFSVACSWDFNFLFF